MLLYIYIYYNIYICMIKIYIKNKNMIIDEVWDEDCET